MTVAVIMKGWPRLSETFIAQETLELERRGLKAAQRDTLVPLHRRIAQRQRARRLSRTMKPSLLRMTLLYFLTACLAGCCFNQS